MKWLFNPPRDPPSCSVGAFDRARMDIDVDRISYRYVHLRAISTSNAITLCYESLVVRVPNQFEILLRSNVAIMYQLSFSIHQTRKTSTRSMIFSLFSACQLTHQIFSGVALSPETTYIHVEPDVFKVALNFSAVRQHSSLTCQSVLTRRRDACPICYMYLDLCFSLESLLLYSMVSCRQPERTSVSFYPASCF